MNTSSLYQDRDLYHRALTGRGAPITSEEVLTLLDECERLAKAADDLHGDVKELEEANDEAWTVPKEEPYRRCAICEPAHDRGDGRCERHGRFCDGPDKDDLEPGSAHWHAERELAEARAEIARLRSAISDQLRAESRELSRAPRGTPPTFARTRGSDAFAGRGTSRTGRKRAVARVASAGRRNAK